MTDLLIKGMGMPKDGDYIFSFASDENGENTICRIEKVSPDRSGTLIQHTGVMEQECTGAQEVKNGKWIETEDTYREDGKPQSAQCSVCGLTSERPLGNYCKYCGAKMEGEL